MKAFLKSSFLIFLFFISFNTFSQYGPLHWDLRGYDSIPDYRKAMNAFNAKDLNRAIEVLDSVGEIFLTNNNYYRYYQINNEKTAMLYIHRELKKAHEVIYRNVQLMSSRSDTLHYEFAIAMRLYGYISDVWNEISHSKEFFMQRQYEVLKAMGDDSPIFAECLGDLGLYYIYTPEKERALDYLLASKELAAKHEMSYSILITDHTIATQLAIEQPNLALEIFENQYNTMERSYYRDSVSLIFVAYSIAEENRKINNYHKAIEYYKEAYRLLQALSYPHLKLIAGIPLELAKCYSNLNDFENFKKYASISIGAYNQIRENKPFPEYILMFNIGKHYMPFNIDSALHYTQMAHSIAQQTNDDIHDIIAKSKTQLAEIFLEMGQYDVAVENIIEAVNIITGFSEGKVPSFSSKSSFDETLKDIYLASNEIFTNLYEKKFEQQYLEYAISSALCADTLLRRIALNISDANSILTLSREYNKLTANVLHLLVQSETNCEIAFRFISSSKAFQLMSEINRISFAQSAALHDSLWQKKIKLEEAYRELNNNRINALLKTNKALKHQLDIDIKNNLIETLVVNYKIIRGQNQTVNPFEADNAFSNSMANLGESNLLVDFFLSENAIYTFCLDASGAYITSIERTLQFDETVSTFTRDIKTGGNHKVSSQRLSDLILKPFADRIASNSRIIIIPDRELFQIPLEILPNPNTGRILLETHPVSYHYSSTLWNKSAQSQKPNDFKILAVAPVYSDNQSSSVSNLYRNLFMDDEVGEVFRENRLTHLPNTKTEVNEIGQLFSSKGISNRILLEQNATKRNLVENVSNFSIIHIATHGFSSRRYPELSGVFLASNLDEEVKPSQADFGFMHLGEITNLKTNANLVVLSACNSGVGAIYEGEGVMALPRGYFFAGIPNVIASLWKVHDEKTKELMVAFYQYLLEGNTYAESLRLAKLDCIAKGFLPLDWSGFVLIGG